MEDKDNNIQIAKAVDIIVKAMKNDSDFKRVWHSNIAMCCNDALRSIKYNGVSVIGWDVAVGIGDDAADRFLYNLCIEPEEEQK